MKNKALKSVCIAALAGVMTLGNLSAQESEFKPSSNFHGYVFGDVYVKSHADSLGRGAGNVTYKGQNANQTTFQIRRAYISWDYNFAKNFTSYITLANELGGSNPASSAINPLGGAGFSNTDAFGQNTTYIKYAYLKWSNVFPMSNLLIGQIPTPTFATSFNTEPIQGYRNMERTIMDLHNFDSSTDLGVGLNGKVWEAKGGDSTNKPVFVGYNAVIGNNQGAKNQTDANTTMGATASPNNITFAGNSFKKIRANVFVSLLNQQLTIGLNGDYVRNQLAAENKATDLEKETSTFKAYANYVHKWFSVGAEFFNVTNVNADVYQVVNNGVINGTKITTPTQQQGFSVWASAPIIRGKLNVYARMDMFNPDTKYDANHLYSKTASYSVPTAPTVANQASSSGDFASAATGANNLSALNAADVFYKQTFYTVALDWTPNARVHIIPNIWYNGYDAMSSTALRADGSTYKLTDVEKSSYDLVYRVTFHYIFNSSKTVANNGRDH